MFQGKSKRLFLEVDVDIDSDQPHKICWPHKKRKVDPLPEPKDMDSDMGSMDSDMDLPDLPDLPVKSSGASRMTDVIKNIEAMCTGQVFYLDGYELDDEFLDLSEEVQEHLAPKEKSTKYSGYFINSGEVELRCDEDPDMEEALQKLISACSLAPPSKVLSSSTQSLLRDVALLVFRDDNEVIPRHIMDILKKCLSLAEPTIKKKMLALSTFQETSVQDNEIETNRKRRASLLEEIGQEVTKKIAQNGCPPKWRWEEIVRKRLVQVFHLTDLIKQKSSELHVPADQIKRDKKELIAEIISLWPNNLMSKDKITYAVQQQKRREAKQLAEKAARKQEKKEKKEQKEQKEKEKSKKEKSPKKKSSKSSKSDKDNEKKKKKSSKSSKSDKERSSSKDKKKSKSTKSSKSDKERSSSKDKKKSPSKEKSDKKKSSKSSKSEKDKKEKKSSKSSKSEKDKKSSKKSKSSAKDKKKSPSKEKSTKKRKADADLKDKDRKTKKAKVSK